MSPRLERLQRQHQASTQDTLPEQSAEGPPPVRRTGHAQQQRQFPDNVYGSDPVGTEILTDAAWENLLQDPNPQVSGGQVQLLSLGWDKLCSYDSDKYVFYQDSKWHRLYLELITEEGRDKLLNFLLASARRTPPTGRKTSSKPELPDPINIHEWVYKDILKFPEELRKEWRQCCVNEISALKAHNVFELMPLPKGKKAIGNRWVFNIKPDLWKCAHLVTKGFSQIEGINFNELFSPVVWYESVKLLLALTALEDWVMEAVDVKTTFLYGKLDEDIYMHQPEGFLEQGKEQLVWRLKHAIYRLKQAALAWWRELDNSVKWLEFACLHSDAGILINKTHKIIIIAYVDNYIFMEKNLKCIKQAKEAFMKLWECRDLGEAKEFLKMKIQHTGHKLILDQHDYLDKIVTQFDLKGSYSVNTPLPTGYEPEENKGTATQAFHLEYQPVIGSLLYVMIGTWPDISFAVTKMAQFFLASIWMLLNISLGIQIWLGQWVLFMMEDPIRVW